jgi:hypothetical protein
MLNMKLHDMLLAIRHGGEQVYTALMHTQRRLSGILLLSWCPVTACEVCSLRATYRLLSTRPLVSCWRWGTSSEATTRHGRTRK